MNVFVRMFRVSGANNGPSSVIVEPLQALVDQNKLQIQM